MTAKQQILDRVRDAIGQREPLEPITREYLRALPVDLDQFVERLYDYNALVYRCSEADLQSTIGEALAARNKHRVLMPPHGDVTRTELEAADGVVTGCTVAIAITGTIILTHRPNEGRRALTLIPDYHLCIVYANQVVQTVPEGIRALSDYRTGPITTISGPSATADIEMIRVKGVHGPRTLDVILVT